MKSADDVDPWFSRLKPFLDEMLRVSLAVHKRRVALRHGIRESCELESFCLHEDWDSRKLWCNGCGVSAMELIGRYGL